MAGDDFQLKWNEHHSLFFCGAEELLKSEECTDVTLAAGQQLFAAHRMVLSVCSPYFRQLFRRLGTDKTVIYLKDVSASHLELLLNYMYKGEINVKEQELMTVLNVAQGLEIRGLTQADNKPNQGHSLVKSVPSKGATSENAALSTPNTSSSKKRKISAMPKNPMMSKLPSVESIQKFAKQEVEEWSNSQSGPNIADIIVEDHKEGIEEVGIEDYDANPEEVEGDIEDYEGNTEVVECLIEEYDTNTQNIVEESENTFYNEIIALDPINSDICEISSITGGYSCQYCNKSFTQKRNLQVHVKTLHEGIRKPCTVCEHTSSTKSNLRKHMANKHGILT